MSTEEVAPGPASVDLYWLPLGAGDNTHCVRANGRTFEWVAARCQRRAPLDLYHAALEVRTVQGRFIIEMAPVWSTDVPDRGVFGEGPVGLRCLGRSRLFRYEVRCWRDGAIPDVAEAVDSPQRLSADPSQAERIVSLTTTFPTATWGRDELDTGDMWNSNSLVSWLLALSGHDVDSLGPPAHGRAPGWEAGLVVAGRSTRHDARNGGLPDRAAGDRTSHERTPTREEHVMSTLVVYESMWGNTKTVAEAVADGIGGDVRVVHVPDAPAPVPVDVGLLVVGGPTHAFSMTRPSTRRDAVAKGAPEGPTERGVREWLAQLEASEHIDVATFDTRVGSVRHLPGSAAKAAGREVRRHHLGRLVATRSFYVDDLAGPLLPGEVERARAWGQELAHRHLARTSGA